MTSANTFAGMGTDLGDVPLDDVLAAHESESDGTSIVAFRGGAGAADPAAVAAFENKSVPVDLRRLEAAHEDAACVTGGEERPGFRGGDDILELGIRRDFDGQRNRRRGPRARHPRSKQNGV